MPLRPDNDEWLFSEAVLPMGSIRTGNSESGWEEIFQVRPTERQFQLEAVECFGRYLPRDTLDFIFVSPLPGV